MVERDAPAVSERVAEGALPVVPPDTNNPLAVVALDFSTGDGKDGSERRLLLRVDETDDPSSPSCITRSAAM